MYEDKLLVDRFAPDKATEHSAGEAALFEILTPSLYWLLFILWAVILALYLFNLRQWGKVNRAIGILLVILALDAFRTLFETFYFGTYFSSLYGLLPASVADYLGQPGLLILPKLVNLLAGIAVLILLLNQWLPKAIAERQEIETRLGLIEFSVNHVQDALFWVDKHANIKFANDHAASVLGYSPEELSQLTVPDIDPNYQHDVWPQHWAELREKGSLNFQTVHRTKSGRLIPVDIKANLLSFQGHEYNCAIARDISAQIEVDRIIWEQANYDALTGLPNRRLLEDRLAQAISHAKQHHHAIGLLFIDLDEFKQVNDIYSHSYGDRLLNDMVTRLQPLLAATDTLARFGADEFILMIADLENTDGLSRIADSLLQQAARPFQFEGLQIFLSASIGITTYPQDGQSPEVLIRNAEQAMFEAKASGGKQYQFFRQSLQEHAASRVKMLNDLRTAIQEQQFTMFFQPIINLGNDRVEKAEALLRWQHPDKGFISPAEFIPIAEESQLIVAIGEWVFRDVAYRLKGWRQTLDPLLEIGINTSPVQYRQMSTIGEWGSYLEALGLPGSAMVVEITESMLMQDNETHIEDTLLQFSQHGIQIAIDDFGTGYSSLAYIRQFDIDLIKIDKTFVNQLSDDSQDKVLCEAIIVMAHKLGIKVVAEGIETEEQLRLLREMGCDYGQGYLLSRPLPVSDFEAFIEQRN